MLSSRAGASYSAKQAERKQMERMAAAAKEVPLPSPDRLLTDRGSYIAYLESQLERVSAACMTVSAFDERLEQAVSSIRHLEEKMLNLARLVSCTQQFAEQQEAAQREAAAETARRLRAVEARLAELEEPARAAEWENKLRSVSAQVDSKLECIEAAAQQRLDEVAGKLQAGLDDACHSSHLALERRLGETTGRLAEVERKLRAVDEYAHSMDSGAAVADLGGRVGALEGSIKHLAQSDSGMKGALGSLQQAVAQLKTAVVALELRPPLADTAQGSADCMQWLERAREALKREVSDIQQQHVSLAAGLNSALAAAAAAPQSPQKAVAAQVLSGMQCSMQLEVGKELQALQLADNLLASVTSQFKRSPSRPAAPAADTATAGAPAAAVVPPAAAGSGATLPLGKGGPAEQAVAVAAEGALQQLQQLAGGEQQLAAAAALAAAPGCSSGGGGSSLRSTFGQMQQMLHSVCQMLQPKPQQEEEPLPPSRDADPGYLAPTASSRYLSRSFSQQRAGSPPGAGAAAKRWVPGGSFKAAGGGPGTGISTASRSLSFRLGGGSGGGAKEALRDSVLGQKALEERRRRLQQLYTELQQQ